jgi:sugar lactone lactonase YvrE
MRGAVRMAAVLLALVAVPAGCGGSSDSGPVNTTPPKSTNGIQWSSGRLWIASLEGSQIVQVDPDSGEIIQGYGPDDGLQPNDDLVLVDGGALVVTEPGLGTVSRFDPKHGRTVLAEIGSQANGITRCEDGKVFASRESVSGGVFEIDPTGTEPARLVTDKVPGLNSMACVGDDLYAPTFFDGTVIRIQRETGDTEAVAAGMVLASAVHTTPDGSIVALQDAFPARLVKVDLATGRLVELVRLGAMVPDNFAVGPDGTFYVTDFFNAGVVVVSPDGSTRRYDL